MRTTLTLLLALTTLTACGDKDGADSGSAGDDGSTGDDGTGDDGTGDDGTGGGTGDDGTDGGADSGGDGDGGTDSGSTGDDGGTDSGSTGGEFFMSASGTFDGESLSVECDATQLIGASTGGDAPSINLICTDVGTLFSISVAGMGLGTGTYTTCEPTSSVQVTDASTGGYYACTLSGATSFELDVTEYTLLGDGSVEWAGSFELTGSDDSHSTSVSGTFRGRSQG